MTAKQQFFEQVLGGLKARGTEYFALFQPLTATHSYEPRNHPL